MCSFVVVSVYIIPTLDVRVSVALVVADAGRIGLASNQSDPVQITEGWQPSCW